MGKKFKNVYELCPSCANEVKLKANFEVQTCPNCGELIKPCALCKEMECTKCPLDNELFIKRQNKFYQAKKITL